MEFDKKDEPVRIYGAEGYYQLEKITNPSGEPIVQAAYYRVEDEFDPIRTASVPNAILLEQFRLAVLNDLIADKDGLAHAMEEIVESIMRQRL